jgi:hypothetical protein
MNEIQGKGKTQTLVCGMEQWENEALHLSRISIEKRYQFRMTRPTNYKIDRPQFLRK